MGEREWFEILNRTIQNVYPPDYLKRDNTKIYFKDLIGLSPNFRQGLVFRAYGYKPVEITMKAYINGQVYPFTIENLETPMEIFRGPIQTTKECFVAKLPAQLMGIPSESELKLKGSLRKNIPYILQDSSYIEIKSAKPGYMHTLDFLWQVNAWVYDISEMKTGSSFITEAGHLMIGWDLENITRVRESQQYLALAPGIQNTKESELPKSDAYYLMPYYARFTHYNIIGSILSSWFGFKYIGKDNNFIKFYYGNKDFSQDTTITASVPLDCYEGVFVSKATGCLINPDRIQKDDTKEYFNLKEEFSILSPLHFNEGLGVRVGLGDSSEPSKIYHFSFYNPTSQKVFIEKKSSRPMKIDKNQNYDWKTQFLVTLENNNSFAKVNDSQHVVPVNNNQSIALMINSVATTAELFPMPEEKTQSITVPLWDLLKAKHHMETWNTAEYFYIYHYTAGQEAKIIAEAKDENLNLGRVFYTSNQNTYPEGFDQDHQLPPGQRVLVPREDLIGNPQTKTPPSLYFRYGPGNEMIGIAPVSSSQVGDLLDLHRVVLVGPPIAGYTKPYNY